MAGKTDSPRQRKPVDTWSDYIRVAHDANGNSVRLQFRVMPSVEQQINTIVLSRQFPYRRNGDLMRDAVMRHLEFLHKKKLIHPNNLKQIILVEEIIKEEEFQQEFTTVFMSLERVVNNYTSSQQVGEARRVVAATKNRFEAMEDGAMKRRWLKALMDKFGHLLNVRGAKLRGEI